MQTQGAEQTRSLKLPAALFTVTWLIHSADHVRRGTETTPDGVIWGGTTVAVLVSIALTLIVTDHPTAAAVTAAVFPSVALGVAASHLLPGWGPLSEPLLFDSETDALAAVAASLEIAGAAILGWFGWQAMRAGGYRLRAA